MPSSFSEDNGGFFGHVFPPMPPPSQFERTLIENYGDLTHCAGLISQAPILAVDVEFVAAKATDSSSTPRLALIQIFDGHQTYVIDAMKLFHLSILNEPFMNPAILKIFHGVGSDLRVLGARDLHVQNIIDIEAVCRSIFGAKESGLQSMMLRSCGYRMDKTLQRSDWTLRPLTSAMFLYAARDAEMTYQLYLWLTEYYADYITAFADSPYDLPIEKLAAEWLTPFLQKDRSAWIEGPQIYISLPASIREKDFTEAYRRIQKPVLRARLIKAAADIGLLEVKELLFASLTALTSEERSAAVRALSKMHVNEYRNEIRALLTDPVYDVRKAAVYALKHLDESYKSEKHSAETHEDTQPDSEEDDMSPWKAKLRGMIPPDS